MILQFRTLTFLFDKEDLGGLQILGMHSENLQGVSCNNIKVAV